MRKCLVCDNISFSNCRETVSPVPKSFYFGLYGSLKNILFREVSVENFELEAGEFPYDLAFAVRVGAMDGRHPAAGQLALAHIARALTKNGKLFIDGGDPLKEVPLDAFR